MSYTDGKRSPAPTPSEQVFQSLTDVERVQISRQWLRDTMGPQYTGRVYKCTPDEEPKP